MHGQSPRFPHRHNPNGSYDSICRICFATVGTDMTEEELVEAEFRHTCDEETLFHFNSSPPKPQLA
jgi:hypothetical protein